MTNSWLGTGDHKSRDTAPLYLNWLTGAMLVAALSSMGGCAGMVSGSAQTQTYGISGSISPSASGAPTTVSLSGPSTATATANSLGAYAFRGLANGSYVITPGHTGYVFSPATQSVTVNGADVSGVNFTTAPDGTRSVSLSWTASPTPPAWLIQI